MATNLVFEIHESLKVLHSRTGDQDRIDCAVCMVEQLTDDLTSLNEDGGYFKTGRKKY
jgi:hypothetical protein